MAASVTTITPDMGEMNIKQHVDDAFDSLFATGSVATTSKGRVSGHGQSSFVEIFNDNMDLLVAGLVGLASHTALEGGTSWQGMRAQINTSLAAVKLVVDAL